MGRSRSAPAAASSLLLCSCIGDALRQDFPVARLKALFASPWGVPEEVASVDWGRRVNHEPPQPLDFGPTIATERIKRVYEPSRQLFQVTDDEEADTRTASDLAPSEEAPEIVEAVIVPDNTKKKSGANPSKTLAELVAGAFNKRGRGADKGAGLDDDDVADLSEQLVDMLPTLRKLEVFGNNRLTAAGWMAVLTPLTFFDARFEDVNFGFCSLTDLSAKAIFTQLSQFTRTIKKIDIAGNEELTPGGWTTVLSPMTRVAARIEEFSLGWCNLDDIKAFAIAQESSRLQPTVKKIDFTGSADVTSVGWRSMLRPMSAFQFHLEEVDFGWCFLNDQAALVIGAGLGALNPNVRRLAFRGNGRLSPQGWQALLTPLARQGSGMAAIDFSSCKLGDGQAGAIGEELNALLPSLRSLNFQNNTGLSMSGWKALLSPMTITGFGFEDVDFSSCSLDDSRARIIRGQLMAMQPTVRSLRFGGNSDLSLKGWTELLHPLAAPGSGFEVVDFSGCDLGDEHARAISEVLLAKSKTLRKIICRGNNRLSPAGWKALLKSLTFSTCVVEEINFGDCDLTDLAVLTVAKHLTSLKPTVTKIDFDGCANLSPLEWGIMFRPLTDSDAMGDASASLARI